MSEKVIGAWRRIDILINNAGINFAKRFSKQRWKNGIAW